MCRSIVLLVGYIGQPTGITCTVGYVRVISGFTGGTGFLGKSHEEVK